MKTSGMCAGALWRPSGWMHLAAIAGIGGVVGATAQAATVSFTEGLSPDASYVADSTYIRNDGPGPNSINDDDIDDENIVGVNGGASAGLRALFEYDLSAIPSYARIDSVTFDVTTRAEAGVGTSITVALRQYGFDFVESQATWNDPDGDGNAGTGDTTAGGNISGTTLSTATFNPLTGSAGVNFASSANFTDAVVSAVSGDGTLRMIALRTGGSSLTNNFTRWYDETVANTAQRPTLTVDYAAARSGAHFNDISSGQLVGQGGEYGFSGNWTGSTSLEVVAGDLVAPGSTNFMLAQTGTPQSVRGDVNNASGRAVSRTLEEAMTGTVWFSFLLSQPDSSARGGIEINPNLASTGPSGSRIVGVGTSLVVVNVGSQQSLTNVLTLGGTDLILGRIDIDDVGTDVLSLWVNPNVLNLGDADLVIDTANFVGAAGILRVGIESYTNGGTLGGTVDMLSMSDTRLAFNDVTGAPIPTPAALPAGLIAIVSLAARRQRRVR